MTGQGRGTAELPRDVLLRVVRCMDVDTRRGLGIIQPLHVPDRVREALEAAHCCGRSKRAGGGLMQLVAYGAQDVYLSPARPLYPACWIWATAARASGSCPRPP
jgi:hypothetical protein